MSQVEAARMDAQNAPKAWSESGLGWWLFVRLLCCADAVRQLVLHTTTRFSPQQRPTVSALSRGRWTMRMKRHDGERTLALRARATRLAS